mmetsp:Transcript_46534/g.107416  ORF Transcript_46534/g.107416 Transcript_46534/m.107416 type:complete len:309 (+) Transcript_46534:72-998(+)
MQEVGGRPHHPWPSWAQIILLAGGPFIFPPPFGCGPAEEKPIPPETPAWGCAQEWTERAIRLGVPGEGAISAATVPTGCPRMLPAAAAGNVTEVAAAPCWGSGFPDESAARCLECQALGSKFALASPGDHRPGLLRSHDRARTTETSTVAVVERRSRTLGGECDDRRPDPPGVEEAATTGDDRDCAKNPGVATTEPVDGAGGEAARTGRVTTPRGTGAAATVVTVLGTQHEVDEPPAGAFGGCGPTFAASACACAARCRRQCSTSVRLAGERSWRSNSKGSNGRPSRDASSWPSVARITAAKVSSPNR